MHLTTSPQSYHHPEKPPKKYLKQLYEMSRKDSLSKAFTNLLFKTRLKKHDLYSHHRLTSFEGKKVDVKRMHTYIHD